MLLDHTDIAVSVDFADIAVSVDLADVAIAVDLADESHWKMSTILFIATFQ